LKWIFGEFLKMLHFCHILRKFVLAVSRASRGLRQRPTTLRKGPGVGEHCVLEISQFWHQKYFWREIQEMVILRILMELVQNWCIGLSGA